MSISRAAQSLSSTVATAATGELTPRSRLLKVLTERKMVLLDDVRGLTGLTEDEAAAAADSLRADGKAVVLELEREAGAKARYLGLR
jgi:hypothetical protein